MFIDKEPKINEYKNSHSPKKHIQQTVNAYFIILVIFAIFLFFMYLISREDYDLITSWLKSNETIVLGIAIILVVVTMAQTLSTADKMRKNIKAYKEIINDYVNEMNPVFEDLNDVWIITGFSYTKMNKRIHLPDKQYYWFDPKHQSFSFVQVEPTGPYKVDKTITSIPLSKMRHYEVVGDKYYENKISGGGSQGPNYTGAIIGEALFGVAGAVAGGQQKIDPIQSQVILHDE
ncbi:MAG TPA: hypothetical protein PKU69_02580, partial [Bacillota bacterium]|nr:hypothetical protein [Bacillota bacterium]